MKETLVFTALLLLFWSCENLSHQENLSSVQRQDTLPLTKKWEFAIPNQRPPKGIASLSAQTCGACHQQHYREWLYSTHSHAWTDVQFQAELKKETSPYFCINCHIPLQNQQEHIVTGMINGDIYQPVKHKNPQFDAQLQQEGINCTSCHVRDGYVIGPYGNTNAPHPVKKDTVHLSEQLCISCHNATAVITPTLVCSFETGDEWRKGPCYGKKNCISCHMPDTLRSIATGFPERKAHQHFFAGSGIPKVDTARTKMLNGLQFFTPETEKTKDSLIINFTVKNAYAGHRVPTGDPERYILIHLKVNNQNNETLVQKTVRIGEQWEWYPKARKVADNNLNPGESRTFSVTLPLQSAQQAAYLDVLVEKYRSTQAHVEYNKLPTWYPIKATAFQKRYPLNN